MFYNPSKVPQFRADIRVISEPYNCANTFGPEGFATNGHVNGVKEFGDFQGKVRAEIEKNPDEYREGWDDDACTFDWVKQTLEGDHPGKKIVLCKDFIYPIVSHFDKVPRGFTHSFIIRNPTKVFLSNRKSTMKWLPPDAAAKFDINDVPSWNHFPKYGYGEMLDLIAYLKDQGLVQSDPIIIDADDLRNHPASIIRQYCHAVGVPFTDSLLKWEAGDGCVSRCWYISKGYLAAKPMIGFYDDVMESTEVNPPEPLPDPVPEDVVKLAARAEPYYQELYKMRIKP